MKLYEKYEGKRLRVAEKIQQRRRQLLVHSYIYYELNTNIVSDAQWSKWAKELTELQKKYPATSKRIPYAKQFQDWDGSTGAFLEYDDVIIGVAEKLLSLREPKKKVKSVKTAAKHKKRRLF